MWYMHGCERVFYFLGKFDEHGLKFTGGDMVVKIASQLVRFYEFTSQEV